jgi:peptide/nickel transport system substrate-binding protein
MLERFDGYYGGSPENPPVKVAPLKHLVFKTVTDQVLRTAMLKKGQADIITNIPLETIPLFDVLPDIEVMSQPATRSYFADLNCMKPPFDDPRARVAVNYAMDMRMVINTIFQGRGQILPTILLQQAFSFNDQLAPYPYDPEAAQQMFREADFPSKYTIKIVCIEKYGNFANAISLFLSKVGIQSTITIDEKTAVRAAMKNLEADILVTSWGNTTLDPVGILLPKLKSDGRGNFSNYSNETVDQLLLLAESTLVPEERDAYYKEVQDIVYREAPMLFGYAIEEFYGVRKRVKGFYPSATGMLNLHDVYVE